MFSWKPYSSQLKQAALAKKNTPVSLKVFLCDEMNILSVKRMGL